MLLNKEAKTNQPTSSLMPNYAPLIEGVSWGLKIEDLSSLETTHY